MPFLVVPMLVRSRQGKRQIADCGGEGERSDRKKARTMIRLARPLSTRRRSGESQRRGGRGLK
jgi:hypothetical protein